MKGRVVSVTEFKAKCLALLNEIGNTGEITVTKRGKPIATVGPPRKRRRKSSEGILAGKVFIPDEILMADYSDLYDVVNRKSGDPF